jgi:hypothetical protein
MITVDKFSTISRAQLTAEVESVKWVAYRISGLSVHDLQGSIDDLNDTLTDDVVEDGYLLSGMSYKFVAVAKDGTATVEVSADASEWMAEAESAS